MGRGRVVRQLAPLAGGGVLVATDPGDAGSLRWRVLGADGDVAQDLGRAAWVEASRDGRLLARQVETGGVVTAYDERGRRLGSSDLGGRVVAVAGGWVWATSQTGTRGWEVATGDERTLDRRLVAVSADGRRAAADHS